jgi:hypothetical protein
MISQHTPALAVAEIEQRLRVARETRRACDPSARRLVRPSLLRRDRTAW